MKTVREKMSRHDKTKSGGLFDMFSSKSVKRGSSSQYNGKNSRPVSTNENDQIVDLQAIENSIYSLTIEEVNKKFMELLDDMNLKDSRLVTPLMKKNTMERREMLIMHLKGICLLWRHIVLIHIIK